MLAFSLKRLSWLNIHIWLHIAYTSSDTQPHSRRARKWLLVQLSVKWRSRQIKKKLTIKCNVFLYFTRCTNLIFQNPNHILFSKFRFIWIHYLNSFEFIWIYYMNSLFEFTWIHSLNSFEFIIWIHLKKIFWIFLHFLQKFIFISLKFLD